MAIWFLSGEGQGLKSDLKAQVMVVGEVQRGSAHSKLRVQQVWVRGMVWRGRNPRHAEGKTGANVGI